MYPSDVPHSKKECTPNVPHLDFHKPHLKIWSWQPCMTDTVPKASLLRSYCETRLDLRYLSFAHFSYSL